MRKKYIVLYIGGLGDNCRVCDGMARGLLYMRENEGGADMKHLDHLQTPTMYRPYTFDHVEVSTNGGGFCIIGKCYSEYLGGPSLFELADAAGELTGPGYYGLRQCRYIGYKE